MALIGGDSFGLSSTHKTRELYLALSSRLPSKLCVPLRHVILIASTVLTVTGKKACIALILLLWWSRTRIGMTFGHSTVRPFLPGRVELGRIGWVAVQDGGISKSKSIQPRNATTRVTLY